MDAYKSAQQDDPNAPKKPGTGPLKAGTGALGGTGALSDSFQSSGTGPLARAAAMGAGGTRRLNTGSLDVEKTLAGMRAELDNGTTLITKFEPRMAVLNRAVAIADRPVDANAICAGISPGEAGYTKQVAQVLIMDPGIKRRVQVATYQFEQAKRGLAEASEAVQKADLYEGPLKAQYVETQIQVEKLRGQLYPLINLHMVFRDNELLAQLIPAPKAPPPAAAFPPPPSEPEAPSAAKLTGVMGTGPLAAAALADDPAVAQMVETISRVTGSLKDKLSGFLKKKE